MKANISNCLCGLNIASKLLRSQMKFSNKWNGSVRTGVLNMAILSSSAKEISPQTVKSIENYFKQKDIKFQHGHTTIMAKCPFCANKSSNVSKMSAHPDQGAFSLFVNKMTGSHICNSCGTSGTWQQLKTWVSEENITSKPSELTSSNDEGEQEKVLNLWEKTKPFGECKESLRRYIVKKVEIQPLSSATLKFYRVHTILHKFSAPDGSQKQQLCLAFPWYNFEREKLCGIKLHKAKMKLQEEGVGALEPRHGLPSMFGWHTVPSHVKEIVLTADEFDAMAIYQATSFPAISLPLGLSSLPPEVLPHLEQFEKIILWFRNDVRSRQAANKFARKLNIQRCHFVRMETSGPASALDALRRGCDLKSMLSGAQAASHKQIVTFQQLRDEVYNELCNVDQVAGIKWTRFQKLSEILKGHRRGELTVFTGGTGTGKTTLLSELSVDLCAQGVNTLWGSFEVRNVRLAKTMLNQFSGLNLEKNLPQYNYWAEKFEMLPMYFMSFYGAQNLQDVLETMSHAAYVYDIEHVIVDNLQFMISNSYSPDRFHAQNVAIGEFRKFATSKNVHVTIVIHPRKESDDAELQTASIFGSAKASQEADNVIILQDKKGKNAGKYLQVTKNRFDGTLGKVYLDFNRDSLSMSSYQTTSASASSKKENKLVRTVKPPKTGFGPKRITKSEPASEERIATDDRATKLGNREKANLKGKNIGNESSTVEASSILSDNMNKVHSIKAPGLSANLNINSEPEAKPRSQNYKDKNMSNTPPSAVASSRPSAGSYDMKESNTSFKPSTQAVKLKKDDQSKGTALSTKATRFIVQTNKKSLSMGKKISVKQLDVNKVYLQ
ncbi:twinkle protein, mitochondrial-like [Dendronephthya gigantea]|uniref:twinkle protein, mitochondrial-like n=1 Tax=Dendronephthya gigantea TaxID=151771 RepID=UPI00106BD822|nr:twinkle protein, mitochondrial-like [Dendronephthya gigantea]